EGVGGDEADREALDAPGEHGAAVGEVVAGGAGRRRRDQPVAADVADLLAGDAVGELGHRVGRPARERDVVQGRRRPPGDLEPRHLEHLELARERAAEAGRELLALDRRQEPDPPEVHGEHRHRGSSVPLQAAQDGAVAAEHEAEAGVVGEGVHDRQPVDHPQLLGLVGGADEAPAGGPRGFRGRAHRLDLRRGAVGKEDRSPRRRRRRHAVAQGSTSRIAASRAASGRPPMTQWMNVSRLPFGPASPDGAKPAGSRPAPCAARAAAASASRRLAAERTTPPLPTRRGSSSNWGLTSASTSPAGARQAAIAGRTLASEMNDTSTVASDGAKGSASGRRWRAFVRSITTTRGSWRSAQSSWPRPTSSAITRAAPRFSRQSVKPPVEAPTSRQSRPATSTPSASRALASFSPPREAKRRPSSTISSASSATSWPGFTSLGPLGPSRTRPARIEAAASLRERARPRAARRLSALCLATRRRYRASRSPHGAAPSAATRAARPTLA